jgi:hypothetical protein
MVRARHPGRPGGRADARKQDGIDVPDAGAGRQPLVVDPAGRDEQEPVGPGEGALERVGVVVVAAPHVDAARGERTGAAWLADARRDRVRRRVPKERPHDRRPQLTGRPVTTIKRHLPMRPPERA